jgi:hypothetical protein
MTNKELIPVLGVLKNILTGNQTDDDIKLVEALEKKFK